MSDTSRHRQHERDSKLFYAYWLEPKRRFYLCLVIFVICGFLEHASQWFFLGVYGALFVHVLLALRMGNIYVRTISLPSRDAVYQRGDPPYYMVIAIHLIFLSLGTYVLLFPR